jgi:hypothetical protein
LIDDDRWPENAKTIDEPTFCVIESVVGRRGQGLLREITSGWRAVGAMTT